MADYTCGLYLKHLLSIDPHVDKSYVVVNSS